MSKDCPERVCDLEDLLDLLCEQAREHECITLDQMLETVGRRSYGPILLLVGLIAITPLSGIPGMPTALGSLVLLISVQMLWRAEGFWLPKWILRRRVSRSKLERAVNLARRPARGIDRLLRPRLVFLTRQMGYWTIVIVCALVAATMPPLELLPFVATTAGLALTTFALALITRDGVLALLGFAFTGGIAGLVIYQFV